MNSIGKALLGSLLLATMQGVGAQGRPANDAGGHRHDAEAAPAAPAQVRGGMRGMGREWTQYPTLAPVMREGPRERGSVVLKAQNVAAATLDVFAPNAAVAEARRQLPVDPEGTRVNMLPRIGNFYWVSARAEQDGKVTVASTLTYFSEPGPAPTRLLDTPKHELEIVPQPHPREHSSYRESEKWEFAVRFDGRPLANAAVKMETEFGTRTVFHSNADGIATVLFPRDIKPAPPPPEGGQHTRGPRRARFVLAAETENGGKKYLTAYNDTYALDPDRTRSLGWGAAFGLIGMAAAAPLLRRRGSAAPQGDTHA